MPWHGRMRKGLAKAPARMGRGPRGTCQGKPARKSTSSARPRLVARKEKHAAVKELSRRTMLGFPVCDLHRQRGGVAHEASATATAEVVERVGMLRHAAGTHATHTTVPGRLNPIGGGAAPRARAARRHVGESLGTAIKRKQGQVPKRGANWVQSRLRRRRPGDPPRRGCSYNPDTAKASPN